MRQSDIKAVATLLEFDWESPEALAKAMIETYENSVADRTTYAGVIQLDLSGPPSYVGVGYFPGSSSARRAVVSHPAAGMARKIAVVPMVSPKGLTKMVAELDAPPLGDGDFALVREDAALYKIGWDGKQKTRRGFLIRLNGK
jgi:hypothetical protein